jgi:hypothetical protein
MIEAGLVFEGTIHRMVSAFTELSPPLRPIHFSCEEKVGSDADLIEDQKLFTAFVTKNKSGFFLLGPTVTYSIRIASGRPVICDCFIDAEPEFAKHFLIHMSKIQPLFGFACAPGERERRNRVTKQQGANSIESWVGRDAQKYVPGFYWLTLLPENLAKNHGISLSAVANVALEHSELDDGQHMFRFYDQPEDWQATSRVTELCASLPGVFNIEQIEAQLQTATTFLALNSMLKEWG